MATTVDQNRAEQILVSCIEEIKQASWKPRSPQSDCIESVILGTHKTYRYILLTGLLAKSTNSDVDALALQVSAGSTGAYDARSLCHSVIVPTERKLLDNRLGASNEPYLNKPARFPTLSTSNAVRRGNDTLMLEAAIEALSTLADAQQARTALMDCLYWIFERPAPSILANLTGNVAENSNSEFLLCAKDIVNQSMEGESCAIIAGVSFSLYGQQTKKQLNVKVHKVNQAGSSSKEISDVDVYEEENLVFTAEIKDKAFTKDDVQHAVSKCQAAGFPSLIFITGLNATLKDATTHELISHYHESDFNLYFIDVLSFFSSVLALSFVLSPKDFIQWIDYHADQAKIKDTTKAHILTCLSNRGW